MSEKPVVQIGENTPEHIALKLLQWIAVVEGVGFQSPTEGSAPASRQWLLDTYAECILAIKNPSGRIKK